MELYTMWAEWDIGQQRYVFTSVEDAKAYLQKVIDNGYLDPEDTVEELWGDLVGVDRMEIYNPNA